jgi:hypothetical protein
MPSPLVPLALVGATVWVIFGGVRRRRRRRTSPKPPLVLIPVTFVDDAPVNAGAPGERCDVTEGLGAWDREGRCKLFWVDGTTDAAILEIARRRWEKRGKPPVSEMCFSVPDPLGGEYAAPVDNPVMVEIVADSLHEHYGVSGEFPPSDQSHYWVKAAYKRASSVVRRELCGAE